MTLLYSFLHLLGFSYYPLFLSFHLYFFCTSLVLYFKFYSLFFIFYGGLSFFFLFFSWTKDILMEGLSGCHNYFIMDGFKFSFLLFVFSEVMFFFSIFWVFFDVSFSPPHEIGLFWPPLGVSPPSFLGLPLLGTLVLLSSGVSITFFHNQLLSNFFSVYLLFLTFFLGVFFLFIQFFEYYSCFFSISEGVYGSLFFFSTGFHGFHVFLGVTLIFIMIIRFFLNHFSVVHHLGFECSSIYWHFVDLVWLFLYIFVYFWGFKFLV